MKLKKILLILSVCSLLTGCSLPTQYERDPSSTGFGRDDMKKSRCACMQIYKSGKWIY